MPPKAEITKEMIIRAAFELTRVQGLEVVTARNIAKKINCSTQPIYSLFENMDEIKSETYQQALDFQRKQVSEYKSDHNSSALDLAIGMLCFAKTEKHLFRTIYLSGLKTYSPLEEKFIGEAIAMEYLRQSSRLKRIDEAKLREIVLNLTIYLIGLGTMINTKTLDLDIEEATEMVRKMYDGLLLSESTERNKGE
ncbi:TetR/AcrR family transcriptional regulator [Evansella sp. AB-rgal1]|uniref:TetR/AcrR family transcriptional regulator n=1 Tax=Evansella sp. AB-rgal1 TaxID=3242696 RepID=UPI00359E6814